MPVRRQGGASAGGRGVADQIRSAAAATRDTHVSLATFEISSSCLVVGVSFVIRIVLCLIFGQRKNGENRTILSANASSRAHMLPEPPARNRQRSARA